MLDSSFKLTPLEYMSQLHCKRWLCGVYGTLLQCILVSVHDKKSFLFDFDLNVPCVNAYLPHGMENRLQFLTSDGVIAEVSEE